LVLANSAMFSAASLIALSLGIFIANFAGVGAYS
jgi:hypothetical protein